jgi:hypothetical protein
MERPRVEDERPQDMEGSWEYIEQAAADKLQGVVVLITTLPRKKLI